MNKRKLKKLLRSPVTFMLIPHHAARPFKATVSLFWLAVSCAAALGAAGTSFFIITRHTDYYQTRRNQIRLEKEKAHYSNELLQLRISVADLKELERELPVFSGAGSSRRKSLPRGEGGFTMGREFRVNGVLTPEEFDENVRSLRMEIAEQKDILSRLKEMPLLWPAAGRITSAFGYRSNPFSRRSEFHCGIDIAGYPGTPIQAPADAGVVQANWDRLSGNFLVLRQGRITTKFAHCQKVLVSEGETGRRGQVVALMGNTGLSTGTHVHYEVLVDGRLINPLAEITPFLKAN